MKAGAEAHFLAGQIFMLGVATVAVWPRMPNDPGACLSIGGRVSQPFRKALLGLVSLAIIRVAACHLHHPDSSFLKALDGVLGTIHVVGQSFLCLTTAYLLQCQLADYINLGERPGQSLIPWLTAVLILTVLGAVLSETVHPNLWALVNLAEATSTWPVLKTLRLYASVTTVGGRQHGRGSVLTQILICMEYWYLLSCLLSFVAEALDDIHDSMESAEGRPIQIVLEALRHHQDNGVDDWTRLLLHSVFLNSIDELGHFTPASETNDGPSEEKKMEEHSLVVDSRKRKDASGWRQV